MHVVSEMVYVVRELKGRVWERERTDFILGFVDPPPLRPFGLGRLGSLATSADADGEEEGEGEGEDDGGDEDGVGEGAWDVDVHVWRHGRVVLVGGLMGFVLVG